MARQSVLLSGQVIPLDGGGHTRNALSVGSNPQADITISLSGVSWQHARIIKSDDGEYYIEDLNSTNGTWLVSSQVNSQGIKERKEIELEPKKLYKLQSGEHVIFGSVEVTFTFSEHYQSTGELYLQEILNAEAEKSLDEINEEMPVNEPKNFLSQIIENFVNSFRK